MITYTVNAGYFIFPALPVPDLSVSTAWVYARPDYNEMQDHLYRLLNIQVGRQGEKLVAQGRTVTGYTAAKWAPSPVYTTRHAFPSADVKRINHSAIPNDGIGEESISTFYGWTLEMGVQCT
jgi:hypothetical protein